MSDPSGTEQGERPATAGGGEGRYPCLDGLRGTSILLVLLSHATSTPDLLRFSPDDIVEVGNIGVRLFFILSGFLFTTMLVQERERTGTISLKAFYMRRTLRIFPAFYAYIVAIAVASALGWLVLKRYDVLAALTFTMNYHPNRAWELGHLWSLAVTEQFYLVWPATVLVFGRRGATYSALAALVIAPLARVVLFLLFPGFRVSIGESFETVFDAIAVGALVALVAMDRSSDSFLDRVLRHPATPLVALVVSLATHALHPHVRFSFPIGETITNVGLGLVVGGCLVNPSNPVGRVLQSRFMAWIGSISFSLYLTQQPFNSPTRNDWATHFPVNVALAIVSALALHYSVELPFMRLRSRLTKKLKKAASIPPPLAQSQVAPRS
ncbi:MAG: acyltransferase [Polyangiaceae bacterium]